MRSIFDLIFTYKSYYPVYLSIFAVLYGDRVQEFTLKHIKNHSPALGFAYKTNSIYNKSIDDGVNIAEYVYYF